MMSIFDLRSRDDARRFIHSAAPALAVALVSMGVFTSDVAMLGVAVVLAFFSDTLAHINSPASFRKWFYPVMTALTTMMVAIGIVTDEKLAPLVAIVTILVGGGMAAKQAVPRPAASSDDDSGNDEPPPPAAGGDDDSGGDPVTQPASAVVGTCHDGEYSGRHRPAPGRPQVKELIQQFAWRATA